MEKPDGVHCDTNSSVAHRDGVYKYMLSITITITIPTVTITNQLLFYYIDSIN